MLPIVDRVEGKAGKKIEDNPSFSEIRNQVEQMQALKKGMPFLRPLLRVAGVNLTPIAESLSKIDDLTEKFEAIAKIPDVFNSYFAARGFIAYDMLSVSVAEKAIELAKSGAIDQGERILIDHYDIERIRFGIQTMKKVRAFRSRWNLAQLAADDYHAGRYHACIPVVLSIIDGVVNEVNSNRQGFFAKDANLEAWDSLDGHSSGLATLVKLLTRSRSKTRTEEITLPYRNGIVHGTDLGYANKTVAAKTWALLFAVREWAVKAEDGQLEAPTPEQKKSLIQIIRETAETTARTAAMQRAIEVWRPRDGFATLDACFIADVGTPEWTLVKFLEHWKRRNYGGMAEFSPVKGSSQQKEHPARMRANYEFRPLVDYKLLSIEDQAAAATNILAEVKIQRSESIVTEIWLYRMIYQKEDGSLLARGQTDGCWTLYTSWQNPK